MISYWLGIAVKQTAEVFFVLLVDESKVTRKRAGEW